MIKHFYGPNTYAARQAIDQLAQENNARISWLDREHLEQQPLAERLAQGSGGLFGHQLFVIRDRHTFPKALQAQMSKAVAQDTPALLVIWDRIAPDKRSSLWRTLKPHGQEFSFFDQPRLVAWLVAVANKQGVVLTAPAATMLIQRLGHDQWHLASELEKLALLANPITPEQVAAAVPVGTLEAEVFTLLDALTANQSRRVSEVLENLLAGGENELYILSMLAYQFRTLFLIQSGQAATAGVHPYVVNKQATNAGRYSANQLQDTLAKILATDFSVKQGKVDARTGLTMLVLGLSKPPI